MRDTDKPRPRAASGPVTDASETHTATALATSPCSRGDEAFAAEWARAGGPLVDAEVAQARPFLRTARLARGQCLLRCGERGEYIALVMERLGAQPAATGKDPRRRRCTRLSSGCSTAR